jgi:hypothetical protein
VMSYLAASNIKHHGQLVPAREVTREHATV